jgi:mercuric ion binding protein
VPIARFRLKLLLLALLSASALAGEPKVARLEVSGMVCPLCPITVRKALERVPGVLEAKADLATKSAEAKYDPDKVSPEALAKAVSNAGFPAKVVEP